MCVCVRVCCWAMHCIVEEEKEEEEEKEGGIGFVGIMCDNSTATHRPISLDVKYR